MNIVEKMKQLREMAEKENIFILGGYMPSRGLIEITYNLSMNVYCDLNQNDYRFKEITLPINLTPLEMLNRIKEVNLMQIDKNKIKLLNLQFNYHNTLFESVNVRFSYEGKEDVIIIKSPKELTIDEIKDMLIEHYNYPKCKGVV